MTFDPTVLPADLPRPEDDGAADHLVGRPVPPSSLSATTGELLSLWDASAGRRLVVFAYPRTGRPGEDSLVADWDDIPGARGCTPEANGFRERYPQMRAAGAEVVGLSTQDPAYQAEAAGRLGLPFPLLSDERLELTQALDLPTLEVAGQQLLRRLTLIVRDGVVEHVWYPVFPPDTHAADVLAWLTSAS